MKHKTKSGFTLIELLVVISIIGLLSSVVLGSVNTARQKARDGKRFADLRQFNNAIQLSVLANNGVPPTTGGAWKCNNCTTYLDNTFFTTNFVTPGYLPSIPKDPSVPASGVTPSDKGYLYMSNGVDYKVMVYGTLESKTVSSGQALSRCASSCSTITYPQCADVSTPLSIALASRDAGGVECW